MKYIISTTVAGSPGYIEIGKSSFLEKKEAIRNLFQMLFLEEKFDLLIENYFEYENELLIAASRMMIFNDENYFSMSKDRNVVSRRIVNLLSAGRMYIDQTKHHLNNIYGKNSSIPEEVKSYTSTIYDKYFGYRAMKALRNYVQHRGFPIHSIGFPHHRVQHDEKTELLYSVTPYIKISSIEEDKRFKSSILDEMKEIQEQGKIGIKPLIREYIEGIGKIHEKVCNLSIDDINIWEKSIQNIIEQYKSEFGDNASIAGLALIKLDDDDHWTEKSSIFMEFIEKRKDLENKNRKFDDLHKCFATNQIRT